MIKPLPIQILYTKWLVHCGVNKTTIKSHENLIGYKAWKWFIHLRRTVLDCAKLGVLYAKKLEQSPKALPLKIFGGQLFWNFLTRIGLKYKKFHLDDTFWNYW